MRILVVATLGFLCAVALADRIMLAPTATKVRYRQARFETAFEATKSRNAWGALTVGVLPEVEAELFLERWEGKPTLGTVSLSYQYLPPLMDTAPGLAIGVQDAADRTALGRMYYVAFTMRKALDGEFVGDTPLELTMGFGFGRRSGVFGGVSLPFTWQFRLLAEHDLRGPRAGLEYRMHSGLAFRTMFEEGRTSLAARYTVKF